MTEKEMHDMANDWLKANDKHPGEVRYGAFPLGFINGWMERTQRAEALLRRLQQWDHMQPPTADGAYWLQEIAAVIGERPL